MLHSYGAFSQNRIFSSIWYKITAPNLVSAMQTPDTLKHYITEGF